MRHQPLWKETVKVLALGRVNVAGTAVAGLASAVAWNPLPVILWTLGSSLFVALAASSPSAVKLALRSLRHQALGEQRRERAARVSRLPDRGDYHRVRRLAREAARLTRGDVGLELEWTTRLSGELERLEDAYLIFLERGEKPPQIELEGELAILVEQLRSRTRIPDWVSFRERLEALAGRAEAERCLDDVIPAPGK